MISRIWGVARNDLAVWMRSPAAIAAALLPALGMGMLVAVLTNSVGQQPVALVVQGKGRLAQKMARILEADKDAYLLSTLDAKEAQRAFGEERFAAIIVVPENFDETASFGNASVDLYLNNVDIDLADDLRRSVTRSVAEFDAPQLGLPGELHGPSSGVLLPNPYHVAIAEHDLRETNVSFLQYQVIPILVLIAISAGLLGTGLLTARDFTRGTAKMMILSPSSRTALVLGRLLGGTLVTMALLIPLVALGFVTKHVPMCAADSTANFSVWISAPCAWNLSVPSWDHAAALAALLVALVLMAVGCGTFLGVMLRNERLMTMLGLNAAAYLFFLGGGFTTVAFLPHWIQMASRLLPTSYAIEGLRQALFYPDLAGFGTDLAVLAGAAALSVCLASAALSRGWRRV